MNILLKPAELESDELVKISATKNKLECFTVYYDESFYLIMKKYDFVWSGAFRKWTKTVDQDVVQDRAAEVAHALLGKGLAVSVDNQTIADKVKNNSFEPEPDRLIDICRIKNYENYLEVKWLRADLYKCVRQNLYGSKYLKDYQRVVVPLYFYQEINDFARDYEFLITKTANDKIEEGKQNVFTLFNLEPPKQKNTTIFNSPEKLQLKKNTVDDSLKD